jgi:hypothetical protein
MTPEEISLITLISSIILTIITGIYVILTYLIITQTKKQNDKQINLVTFPHLKCTIKRIIGKNVGIQSFDFNLTNYGDQPAYDVDIFIVGIYFEEDHPLEKLKAEYFERPYALTANKDYFYGIFDRLIFPYLPSKTQMTERIQFPLDTDSFNIFIQYRNSINSNFCQLFWFIDSGRSDFAIGSSGEDRDITNPVPRFEIEIGPNNIDKTEVLVSTNNEKTPKFLNEFLDLFSHSVHRGIFKGMDSEGCEGRGKFKDLT